MTSDAKIGLLLGLIFIFIIAFIINGLPNLRSQANNNELTITAISSQNGKLGIVETQRKVNKQFTEQQIRYKAPLPTKPFKALRITEEKSAVTKDVLKQQAKKVLNETTLVVKKQHGRNTHSPRAAMPKFYNVKSGDNLAIIAQKCYGNQLGNKYSTIMKIFKANANILSAPDEIFVGQRLVIPRILASGKENTINKVAFLQTPKKNNMANHYYTVSQGDNLWQIADEQLGAGHRYDEIVELNADVLENENALSVGMRLKLPAQ